MLVILILIKDNIRRTRTKLQARLFLYLCNGFAKANYIFDWSVCVVIHLHSFFKSNISIKKRYMVVFSYPLATHKNKIG